MNPEGSSIPLTLPLFDGKSYHLWAFRMEAYLEAGDLWEAVEDVYKVKPLSDNPTVAQIKNHKERKKNQKWKRAKKENRKEKQVLWNKQISEPCTELL